VSTNIPTGHLRSRSVAQYLFLAIAFLLFANLVGLCFKYLVGHDYVYGLVPLFDFDTESNIPTLFSTFLLLISASLFFIVRMASLFSGERQPVWLFLSVLFCFLAIDEFSQIHERFIWPVRDALGASGVFYFAWIIPYSFAIGLVSVFVLPTFYRLQHGLRFWFVLSSTVYLIGAIGFEMLGGMYFEILKEKPNLLYSLIFTLEETFEMVGLVLLVYALLLLLERTYGGFILLIPTRSTVPPPSQKS